MLPPYLPTASLTALAARADLLRRTRTFFDDRAFFEVQTPLLSHDTVIDRHIDPISLVLPRDSRQPTRGERLFLQSSPEFAMKRIMAAGANAIYQIAPAFRAGESGTFHNPEFTMLEWYRRDDTLHSAIHLLSEFVMYILAPHPTLACDAVDRIAVRDAFVQYGEIDPWTCRDVDFRAYCDQRGIGYPASLVNVLDESLADRAPATPDGPAGLNDIQDNWDIWFDILFSAQVQPRLGTSRPCIVYDYPASQAALAYVRPGSPPFAERFELFVSGTELANGYHELLDPDELSRRNTVSNQQRIADGKPSLPEASRLLEAMHAGLPPCSGVALGFDRLTMLWTNSSSIDQVIPFPIERA